MAQCHFGYILLVKQIVKPEIASTPWRMEWCTHIWLRGLFVSSLKMIFYIISYLNSKSIQMIELQIELSFWVRKIFLAKKQVSCCPGQNFLWSKEDGLVGRYRHQTWKMRSDLKYSSLLPDVLIMFFLMFSCALLVQMT